MSCYVNVNVSDLQAHLPLCFQLLQQFDWLLDAYVLDFFTECHWDKLPLSWQKSLDDMSAENLGLWLQGVTPKKATVVPLSLLCLRETSRSLSLARNSISNLSTFLEFLGDRKNVSGDVDPCLFFGDPTTELSLAAGQHKDLHHVFRKHVKPKKQHEVARLARLCSLLAKETNTRAVVDVGAGVGHLARLLNYGHQLHMFCLDAVPSFSSSADRFDSELEQFFTHRSIPLASKPTHVTLKLSPSTEANDFMTVLNKSANLTSETSALSHGLIGLHTCGDLAPSLVRLYAKTPTIKFLVSVACCYMKVDQLRPEHERCYPMSGFVKSLPNSSLSYEALEVACHAFENYCDRLVNSEADKLKVHCYRAVLETLLVNLDPPVRRAGLRSVKNAHLLPFADYTRRALDRLGFAVDLDQLDSSSRVEQKLLQWERVVAFYSLRLLLAPVVETAVLLDRLAYLQEQGFKACLVPLFDPRLSPRNFALVAAK